MLKKEPAYCPQYHSCSFNSIKIEKIFYIRGVYNIFLFYPTYNQIKIRTSILFDKKEVQKITKKYKICRNHLNIKE